ncbi:MAG: PAS domain-containing protein [Phycisphaeraceae bacterium]|nr:PAS domain-containing protein [Phycisphaerales bacterium]QOJ17034.1 MAG: PAS domain-containing protein [Phycisphaeraceae bacterium]
MTILRAPRSLVWRLGLALVLVQAVIALSLGAFAYAKVRQFHHDQTYDKLDRTLPLLVQEHRVLMASADAAAIDARCKRDGAETRIRVTIVAPDGVVWGDSHADPATMDNHRLRAEISDALERGEGQSRRLSPTIHEPMLYLARRVQSPDDGRVLGVVRAGISVAAVDADLTDVARTVGLGASLFIGLTFAVFLLMSRHFGRQVSALAHGATRFAEGRLDHRVDPPRASELASLARALNHMAEELGARMIEVRTRQNEVQAILQSMSSGVVALDVEQRVFNLNLAAERLLGVKAESAIGRLLHEVVRQPDLHRFAAAAVAGRGNGPIEFRLEGDTPRQVQAASEPLLDARGVLSGVLIILTDVTQLRRLESMRTDFAANVSHELRTPITNIKGYVETLLEVGADDRERTQKFLRIIKQNSDRLAAIVEDVMSLTRLEQPRAGQTLEKEPTPLRLIVRAVVSQFQAAADAKSIRLVSDVREGLEPEVHGALMEQAVGNLVSNAINYSPPGTTVTIRAVRRQGQKGDEIAISVADQGPGIARIHHARIFERFYRVDKGRSREVGGTGLGLAIVKHIVRVHDGRIEIDSDIGRGSVFTIVLPDRGRVETDLKGEVSS